MNKEIIPHYIAKFAQLFGFLDERKYRDFCIKEDFEKLKLQGMKVEEIEIKLSKTYSSELYSITPETIHFIVYRSKG